MKASNKEVEEDYFWHVVSIYKYMNEWTEEDEFWHNYYLKWKKENEGN